MGDIFRSYRLPLWNYIRSSWPACLAVVFVFVLGLGAGTYKAGNLDYGQARELHDYLQSSLPLLARTRPVASPSAYDALLNNLLSIIAIYFFGLSLIGIPATLALVFFRGMVIGFSVGFLGRDMAGRGVLLAATAILPHNLLYLPALFVGAAAALSFSLRLLRLSRTGSLWLFLSRYTVVMVAVLAVTAGAGMIEVYCSPWLTRMVLNLIGNTG